MIEVRVSDISAVVDRVVRSLEGYPEAAEAATEDGGKTLHRLALGRTPQSEPSSGHSGRLWRSWSDVERVSGGFAFGTPLGYSLTLEEGGYSTVGPRTVAVGGGIFSRQAPGGILGPLLDDESVLEDVVTLIADKILERLEGAGA